MTKLPKEVIDTQKASLDAFSAVQGALFTGFEKLVDLNLKVTKAALDEMCQKAQESVQVKDAQEVIAMSSGLVQPTAEKAVAYSKHVYDIVSGVQAELAKLTEGQLSQGQKQLNDSIEQMMGNAPAGSESMMAVLKSMTTQTNVAYENLTKAAKQAAEAAEKNIQAATSATLKAASDVAAAGATTAKK